MFTNNTANFFHEKRLRNCFFFIRLSYHFAKIAGRRSDAFKYTSKSADLAIRHAAFSEGLIYLQTAKTMLLTKIEYKSLLKIIDLAITDLNRGRNMSFGKLISSLRSDPQLDGYRALKEELESKLKLMGTPKAAPARLASVREGQKEVSYRERSGTVTERPLTSSNSGALPSSLQLQIPAVDTPLKSELNSSQASQRRSVFSPEPKPPSVQPDSVKQFDGERSNASAAVSDQIKPMTSNETSQRPGLDKSARPSLHFQLSYADTRLRQKKKWLPSSCVLS